MSEVGPPQTGKVLASLEQCVPSVLGHGSHSQSSGAAACSPKWWVAGSAQGNCVGGPWGCATQVRMETLASLLLTWFSPRDGRLQGTRWFLCVHLGALGVPTTLQRPVQGAQAWPVAAAVALVYYTVLISNVSLFKRTLKTLFLTLVLREACSCVRGGSGARLSARLLQALSHGCQAASSRPGP